MVCALVQREHAGGGGGGGEGGAVPNCMAVPRRNPRAAAG